MRYNSYIFFVLLLIGCKNPADKKNSPEAASRNGLVKYATRFAIEKNDSSTLVHLFGNRHDLDTTASFFLYRGTKPANLPAKYVSVKIPCSRIAALSSIYAAMFSELGVVNTIAAVDNIDYVINQEVLAKFSRGEIKELAKTPVIDLEQTVKLRPDIVFTYGMGNGEELDAKLLQSKIPVAVSVDHLEATPLARAEWIKLFAAFVDRDDRADSIFEAVEKSYFELRTLAQRDSLHPTVFSELKFGDVWYMPGGKSYVAQLLGDAGANYLWKDEPKTGSLPLSFEQVYARARSGDFWINLSMVKTKKELLSHDKRYAYFESFKKGQIFNNNKTTNNKGYSIYWETGMIHPERILSDLIAIFHPSLRSELKNDLYYYQQIK